MPVVSKSLNIIVEVHSASIITNVLLPNVLLPMVLHIAWLILLPNNKILQPAWSIMYSPIFKPSCSVQLNEHADYKRGVPWALEARRK